MKTDRANSVLRVVVHTSPWVSPDACHSRFARRRVPGLMSQTTDTVEFQFPYAPSEFCSCAQLSFDMPSNTTVRAKRSDVIALPAAG